ncbi:PilW family protein [Cupriavidus basilensis]
MAGSGQPTHRCQRSPGFSMIELMVALTLGMLVLVASTSFYLLTRSTYGSINDSANIEERGQFAIGVVSRMLRQIAYTPPASDGGSMQISSQMLMGLDNCSTPSDSETLGCDAGAAVNASDVLLTRFFGVGTAADPTVSDGSMVDCSGQAVAAPSNIDNAASQRGLSILYVQNGADGLPYLMCKYRRRAAGKETSTFVAQQLVPGVENLQVLFGISTDDDEVADKFVPASQVGAAEWARVFALKVALVVRGDNTSAASSGQPAIQLFGPMYNGADGTFTPTQNPQSARRLFTATVQVRNYLSCMQGDPSCL